MFWLRFVPRSPLFNENYASAMTMAALAAAGALGLLKWGARMHSLERAIQNCLSVRSALTEFPLPRLMHGAQAEAIEAAQSAHAIFIYVHEENVVNSNRKRKLTRWLSQAIAPKQNNKIEYFIINLQ